MLVSSEVTKALFALILFLSDLRSKALRLCQNFQIKCLKLEGEVITFLEVVSMAVFVN